MGYSLIVPQSRIACTFLFHSMYFKQPFSKDRLFYKMAETTPEKRREGPYGSRNYDAENETSKTVYLTELCGQNVVICLITTDLYSKK